MKFTCKAFFVLPDGTTIECNNVVVCIETKTLPDVDAAVAELQKQFTKDAEEAADEDIPAEHSAPVYTTPRKANRRLATGIAVCQTGPPLYRLPGPWLLAP